MNLVVSPQINPQIIPTIKKKEELETLEIRAVVNTLQLVVCLISGKIKASKDGVHAGTSNLIWTYTWTWLRIII